MRLVRFGPAGAEKPGILDEEGAVRDASAMVADWCGKALEADSLSRLKQVDPSRLPKAPEGVRLGSPISMPGKIVCVGLNYADHATETAFELPSEPLVFLKSPTALSGPFDPILIPSTARAVDWEVELALVVGKTARNIQVQEAASHIAGFAVANDITDRGWQLDRGGQWSKGKSADTFAPLGPWLVTTDEMSTSLDMRIWLSKNGQARQESRTSNLVFSVNHIVAYLSEFMTLLPGDLVLTGTPAGVAYNKFNPDYLKEGDVVKCGVEGLGAQRCEVLEASSLDRNIN
jgi:2-keto-4-pentenoate hydratase/2-oxohepta-3-ene-1,7-dioic acid hydratase in catechol pathway